MKIEWISTAQPAQTRGAVLAIGNLDGVHIGHQILLEVGRKRALAQGKIFGVLTFDPHPRRVFRPGDPPFLITPGVLKYERLEASMVDVTYVASFTKDFAHLTATDFVDQILKKAIGATDIVIGHDFHFGRDRMGDYAVLEQMGFNVTRVNLMMDASNLPYSATRVRQALAMGHVDEANKLLGWNFEIRGTVLHGDKRGRELGYPTANVALGDFIHPAYGVYAADVMIEGADMWHRAAINIGIRPMFETRTALLEAHILNFTGDLYGKNLRVRLLKHLRPEMKFESLDALKAQMARDCAHSDTM